MDWLLSHESNDVVDIPPVSNDAQIQNEDNTESNNENGAASGQDELLDDSGASALVAKSIRCDDCGKLFKTNEEVEFHASKTGNISLL